MHAVTLHLGISPIESILAHPRLYISLRGSGVGVYYACNVRHDEAQARAIAWCLQLIDNRSIIARLAPGNRNQNVVITKTGVLSWHLF